MGWLTEYDPLKKTYRVSRNAKRLLLLLLLLMLLIPPLPGYKKDLIYAVSDITHVLKTKNPTPESIGTLLGGKPVVTQRRYSGEIRTVFSFYENDTGRYPLSFSFYQGKLRSASYMTLHYRRRGVSYILLRDYFVKALADSLGRVPDTDKSELKGYAEDAAECNWEFSSYTIQLRSHIGYLSSYVGAFGGELSFLIAPPERIIIALDVPVEEAEKRSD